MAEARVAPVPRTEDDVAMREALGRLPAPQREVLMLLKYADLSVEEVAAVLGTTAGAVKQRAHRAYEKLRLALDEGATVFEAAVPDPKVR